MRLLLVDNLVLPDDGNLARLDVHPHLGLLSLAAVAETAGHSVQIYDPKRLIKSGKLPYDSTLYDRAAIDLLALLPEAIGFTTLGCSFLFATNVAAAIKRREPELPILIGGPHATMLHRQVLERFPQFDVVVRHEAEEVFPAVLAKLEQRAFDGISGITWRVSDAVGVRVNPGAPKIEELDRLPIASYDYYPVRDLALDLMRIEAGRGCPFMCTFCSTASFFQRSFRLKSAERLVAELDILHDRYGVSDFKLDHDLFTVNPRKVLAFCEAVKNRGYRWRASARVDCVDTELLRKMAGAGCVELYFGIETGSARIQQSAKKRLNLALVEPTLDTARGFGIQTTASFITGYPDETEQDQASTLDLLGRCFSPSCLPQLHILAPEPGTPMFEQFSDKLRYDGYADPYNTVLLGTDDERAVLRHPGIFPTYHYYPAVMERSRYTFVVEVFDVLRRVGPILLNYTLRAYGGQLSKLVDGLHSWAKNRKRYNRGNAKLVEAFISAKFGRRHHITSLFRYALLANRVTKQAIIDDLPIPIFDVEDAYQLGPNVHLLSDSHDCGLLLDNIRRDRDGSLLLAESECEKRVSYLINLSGEGSTSYKIAPAVHTILKFFKKPRRCLDVVDRLHGVTGRPDLAFFSNLVALRILVSTTRTSRPEQNSFSARSASCIDA
jgi:radical SAM superfamily enzyme YgiQ (UPF0313 family)